jgi:dipeptidyl aminopeptidase/acylaminoacyl peptidase
MPDAIRSFPMRLFAAALLASTFVSPAAALPLHEYSSLALSPAGDRVAAVESDSEPNSSTMPDQTIVIRNARTGAILSKIDPCSGCRYSSLAFAPDGRLLAIVRNKSHTSIILSTGKQTATVAQFDGIAQHPLFSPDGKSLSVLATFSARKEAGATQPGVRQVGEIGEQNDEQRIAVVPLTGGALRPVSPVDRYVYEYDWLPDGSGFVGTSAQGNGDNNWWVATLDRFDLSTGRLSRIAAPPTQLNFPRVSPDGRTVAFIGGLMSDFGSVGGDIYTVPVGGGTPTDITPGYRGTFTSLVWDRNGLTASALIGDRSTIVPIEPGRGAGNPLWSAPVSAGAGEARFARSSDGRIYAATVQDFEHPTAINVGPLVALRPITHDNDRWQSLVRAQSVSWTNEGFTVQGWLLAPRAAPAGVKAPMIVTVHGGPSAASTPSFVWEGSRADLAEAGYYQFFPNPRGSYGQGEAFTRANIRDFGGGDLRDILAGVDAVEKAAPIDDNRLGLTGGSYGGFMSMWANTQTNRFKAIVAGAGLSDWISYYGTNGIDEWMIPFFGKSMYDDPAPYWDRSAIRTIKQARTPTFIYVGERDIEVPPTQSVEYWHALRAMNVPTSLVIYPDEGHHVRDPEHVLDIRRRTVAWFDHYLGKAGSAPTH